jgi:hypothetical protein
MTSLEFPVTKIRSEDNARCNQQQLMKLPSNLLTNLAMAAGLSAAATAAPAERPAKPEPIPGPPTVCAEAPESIAMREAFKRADVNKDGKLTLEEFSNAYMEIVASQQAKAPEPPRPPIRNIPDNCPGCGLG